MPNPPTDIREALKGRFEIRGELGRGGAATVFDALDSSERRVALKVLSESLMGGPHQARVLRELAMLARLSHPNILPVLESGVVGESVFYSMPYIGGPTLMGRLALQGPLPMRDAQRVAADVAEALHYAHEHGVVHRDVAPQHILFDGDRAVVKEFWIARALSRVMSEGLTRSGMILGTPGYMSPEQIGGQRVDQRSDVYSLAVLIVHMLTNEMPFRGGSSIEVIVRQFEGIKKEDLPRQLDGDVALAVLKALAADPNKRFGSARELVEAAFEHRGVNVTASVMEEFAGPMPRAARARSTAQGPAPTTNIVGALAAAYRKLRQIWAAPAAPATPSKPAPSEPAPPEPAVAVRPPAPRPARRGASVPQIERLRAALRFQYDIQHEVARGMSEVYVARDLRYRGRIVALKVLRAEYVASTMSERFLEEIEITARLSHPGILPLLDSGDADGRPFYVMPFVEGKTLRKRMEAETQLPIADALNIAREVAKALEYAHRCQVVHRDIKPENILLHEGQATVMDFGIALALDRSRDRRTVQGASIGTPEYMSPEQFWDTENIDHRSDVYSLGCVLYEMLGGATPYSGTPMQLGVKHLEAPIPDIRALRADTPDGVTHALRRCLAKDRKDRFESADALASALLMAPAMPSGASLRMDVSPQR